MKKVSLVILLLGVLFFGITAHAELIVRGTDSLGYQLIYDTDLDITWYDYTRGLNTWYSQMSWASTLTVNFGGITFDDWRLPSAKNQDGTGPCEGWDYIHGSGGCSGSEMGHLYYIELGNRVNSTLNKGDFQNLQPTFYWSSTDYTIYPNTGWAWYFYFDGGLQNPYNKASTNFAIAVRDGDVTVVPEPISSTLFIVGGGVLAGRRYWRKKK